MPRFLLDTNIVSFLAKASSPALTRRIQHIDANDLCISSIVEAELRYGLERLPSGARMHALVAVLLHSISILPWDSEAASRYGGLRFGLEQQGQALSFADTMIAAHALAHDFTLVTNDKAFSRIPELRIEDWTKGPQSA